MLYLVAARVPRCRRGDVEQGIDRFGREDVFRKLWLLPWRPRTTPHDSPVGLGDMCGLNRYLVHVIAAASRMFPRESEQPASSYPKVAALGERVLLAP